MYLGLTEVHREMDLYGTCSVVFKWEKTGQLFKTTYNAFSYNGPNYSGSLARVAEVFSKEETITVYEEIK